MAHNIRASKTPMVLLGELFLLLLLMVGEGSAASAPGQTRTHSGGGVTVKVTYLNPQAADGARFEVVLDTHSANLDAYDLKALSILRDEAGKGYEATQAEDKGSGHHRQITLVFPKPPSGIKRLDLLIRDIAGVKERVFRWEF